MSRNHSPTIIHSDGIRIRRLGADDLTEVDRLAQLDSRRRPEGALLGVEIEGRLLAAISLATGDSIADPFSRTGELRALLELRAAQLRRGENRRPLPGRVAIHMASQLGHRRRRLSAVPAEPS